MGNLHRLTSVDGDGAKARQEFFHKLNSDPTFPKNFRKALDGMMPETFESGSSIDPVAARMRA
jgi:hypothetical protein